MTARHTTTCDDDMDYDTRLDNLVSSCLLSFLVVLSPSNYTSGPSVVSDAVDMPCPRPLHVSHIADYVYDFCPLSYPDLGLSILVVHVHNVEHSSFQLGLC